MTNKLTPAELEAELKRFTGSEHCYRHKPKLLLTDGAKFLADQTGCYWLYDIVSSVPPELLDYWFAVVKLTVDLVAKTGVVVIEDGNDRQLYRQEIPLTDFSLAGVTLYLEEADFSPRAEKVLLLPSETLRRI